MDVVAEDVGEKVPPAPCGCEAGMRKAGRAPNGTQRWECRKCCRSVVGFKVPVRERKAVEVARDPVLTAYRHVLANEGKYDVSGLEKLARRNLEENPKEFEKRYRELEADERSSGSGSGPEDVGEAHARRMIGRLLSAGLSASEG